jgi:anti-sigma factor RsiW
MMSTCASIDPLVTPYVDGELSEADRSRVDEHLHGCPPCYSRVVAECAVRELVHARKSGLTADRPSANLRSICSELASRRTAVEHVENDRESVHAGLADPRSFSASQRVRAWWGQPWRTRAVPVALTTSLVMLVSGAFLYQATQYSSQLLAAELAADHVKCFTANSLLRTREEPAAAVESSMASTFGWQLHLPIQFSAAGLELVGARRCLYAEGKVAHLMYRDHGRPVSIFMLPNSARPEELVEVLGHQSAIWSSGDRTFVLVTRGSRDEVQQMASFVKAALK